MTSQVHRSPNPRPGLGLSDGVIILATLLLLTLGASIGSRFLVQDPSEGDPQLVPATVELNGASSSPPPSSLSTAAAISPPAPTPPPSPSAAEPPRSTPTVRPLVHVVVAGETLTSIARRYRTTLEALVDLNDLADPNLIRSGQQLLIPAP